MYGLYTHMQYWVSSLFLSQHNTDINECDPELGIERCEELCTNTVGSYYCKCFDGRTLINETHCTGKLIYHMLYSMLT